ncbi:hypothetical protein ACN9PN_20990 [Klebsiella pasteurii]|uniref:hypothetical protein n=1 Tax=Klebsiella pasteurii TaxID=2587529 RepID=UPI001C7D7DF4|nr:hypothetical protein [Klebsiella pasteurii]MDH0313436.1 hypothetical protein [Klebsiella pasteurii]
MWRYTLRGYLSCTPLSTTISSSVVSFRYILEKPSLSQRRVYLSQQRVSFMQRITEPFTVKLRVGGAAAGTER